MRLKLPPHIFLLATLGLVAACDGPSAPAVATQLGLRTAPSIESPNGAVLAQQPSIQLRDAKGGAVSQSGVPVTVSVASGGGTLGGTTTIPTDGNGRATFTDISIIGVIGPRTLTFGAGTLEPVLSGSITLTPGPPAKLGLTSSPATTAATEAVLSQQPVVQVQDVSGNAVAAAGVSVVAAIASGGGFLGGTTTVLSSATGVAPYTNLSLAGTIGPRTLSFSSSGLIAVTSAPIALTAGAPFQMAFVTEPAIAAQSGVTLTTQPSMRVQDLYGNVVETAGTLVTASTTAGSTTITGGSVTTNASGVATFTTLAVAGAVGSYTLRFTSGTLPVLTAPATTTLSAGPAAALSLLVQPPTAAASNQALVQQPVIQLRDGAGNPAAVSGVTVTATSVSGTASFTGASVQTNSSGIATFTVLAMSGSQGNYTLRFTAPGLTPVNALLSTVLDATCSLLTSSDTDGDRLPDCAENGTGTYVNPQNTGTNPLDVDTDDDGIGDGDEVLGSTLGLNLPAFGVSPLRRDILIEFDWFDDALECGAHSHRPTAAAIAKVVNAFATSPVVNPDGSNGVNIVADYGQGGVFTGGNLILDSDGVIASGVGGAEFGTHKDANIATARRPYFRYTLLPHRYNTNSTSSGQAELPGNDLVVSLYCAGSDQNVANTIMHELGHNLFLRHGGNTDINYKPNYNSVMNYRYQFPGVDTDCTPPGNGLLNYSIGTRITLNESDLDERQGICGSPPGPAVDWDGNGVPTGFAFAWDINRDGSNVGDGIFSVHVDFNDWANLVLTALSAIDGAAPGKMEIISCPAVPPAFLRRR